MRSFQIENFGCRATQADGAALTSLLAKHGMTHTPSSPNPDLIVINTCTVTASADADARAAIRKAHRRSPEARILVTGCYAQRAPQELMALPGVAWVVGNSQKFEIPDILTRDPYHGGAYVGSFSTTADWTSATSSGHERARPNLKIQDGCNNRCTFCIIPSVRGPSRSLDADAIVEQVRTLSGAYPEVVLTGINLGRWGREQQGSRRLPDLMRRLLNETDVQRIRLSSVEPMDWSDDLLDVMASTPRVAKHIHMPLQSGADEVLRRMRRKYRCSHYENRLLRARQAMPDAAFGADVMTGFPGESAALFEESRAFIERMPFTYLHVFTYSERSGTPAAAMPDTTPQPVRLERNRVLREISDRKNMAFRRRMLGRTLSAVTLEQSPYALTENYLRVEMTEWPGCNRLLDVKPVSVTPGGVTERLSLTVLPTPA